MRLSLVIITLFGCGEPPEDPGLMGRYNVQVDGIIGCDNDPELVDWMLGPLNVTGTAVAQTFDFGDGYVLVGSISASGAFNAAATLTIDGEPVGVVSSGTSAGEAGSITLMGTTSTTLNRPSDSDATDDTDEDTSCSINATFSALQIAG